MKTRFAHLTRCSGTDGNGCTDNALVRPGHVCGECERRSKLRPPRERKPHPRKGIEALIQAANTEVVKAERRARRVGRRR